MNKGFHPRRTFGALRKPWMRGTKCSMLKVCLFIAAAALITEPVLAATDPRADDAVTAFGDLCVSLFSADGRSDVDPTRFAITKINDQTARKVKPEVKGPLWDVSGTRSDVHMLVHYEPSGLCVVEVAEADEASVRASFERLVQRTSSKLGSQAQREPDKRHRVEGKDTTTSMWRMKSVNGDVMLAVTTYPDSKFMIQHLMTASYVK